MKIQSKLGNGKSGQTSISQVEALAALYDFDDLMSRCLTQHLYLSLGGIGKAIKENVDFSGNGLEFGLEKRYITPEVLSTLKSFAPPEAEFTENGFTYKFGDVPIKVTFIGRKYRFFEHPEKLVYGVGEFFIPNPFEKYYKARWIIQ